MLNMNNIFKADQYLGGSGKGYFKPGIYSAIKLVSVDKGDNYIDFTYESTDKTVRTLPSLDTEALVENYPAGVKDRKRVFVPDPNKVFPFSDETKEEAYQRERVNFMRTLASKAKALIPEQEFANISGNTYEELADKLISIISANKDKSLFNIKVRLDKNLEYTEIPGRGSDWFQPYIEGKEPTINFSSWEMNNRLAKKVKDNLDELLS